ncbi:ATP-binding protein [Clostridium sp. Ade.TY]|uniref:ATP-binding protein n=1 Tax=Clostridium sp. Ade.TY TaxID=1391647 RepID=UPI0004128213|nr:ATP-binding protein [Clostridium sp. Ade.TY]
MNQAKLKSQTSHVSSNYKCAKCKDTTWIQGKNGLKRCECYEIDLANRLWENFGVATEDIKPLRDYEPWNEITTKARKIAVDYITSFDSIKNDRENGFCLMGQPGAGKTHIVTAVGKALIDKRIPVVYMPYLEVMRELKACSMDEEYYNKKIDKYKRAKVLIIDDLFKDKVKKGKLIGELREADLKHIYPILNYRYLNYLPTLISTECTPMMLLDLDEALGGRILECCGKRFGITFKGDCNYRLKKFME